MGCSPRGCKESDSTERLHFGQQGDIKPVHPKGNQPWIFIGRTDSEAEASVIWPPHVKSWLTGKDPDAGKDWRQEEKDPQRSKWPDGIIDSMDMSLSKLLEMVKDSLVRRGPWGRTETRLSHRTAATTAGWNRPAQGWAFSREPWLLVPSSVFRKQVRWENVDRGCQGTATV